MWTRCLEAALRSHLPETLMDSLKIIREPQTMQGLADELRAQGRRIALVPTMGYLHEGHLSLIREGMKRADILVRK